MLSALTILPLSVTVIGAAFAVVILNHYFATRRRTHELIWGLAFILFALAAATQVLADLEGGWSEGLARTYYLAGAILNVALLGLGTLYLLVPHRWANVGLVLTILLTLVGVGVMFTVPVDIGALGQSQRVDWKLVFGGDRTPAILAAIGSGIGSVLVIGGALWSAYNFWRKRVMKQRMYGVLLLAAGTFIVAAGGTLKAMFNNDHLLYPTMAVGVVVMFVGYLQTIRPTVSSRVTTQPQVAKRTTSV